MARYRKYWDKEIETMPPAKREKMENEKLRKQLGYVYGASPFYKKKFDDAAIHPRRITSVKDLPGLPFTTKDELRQTQAEVGGLGGHQCAPISKIIRIQGTSGTTGTPLFI